MKLNKFLKKYGVVLIISLLVLAVMISFPMLAKADFGGFSGGSDYGGGGSWSSGGSSWDSGSSSWGSSGSGSDLLLFGLFDGPWSAIILVIIVVLFFVFRMTKGKGSSSSRPAGATPTNAATLNPMNTYNSVDPGFREGTFSEKLSNLYVQMQNGWTAKDIESLRPYFTDAYFTQMERQLNQLKASGKTNYVDNVTVLGVELKGWKQEGGLDHIIVTMKTRIIDYTLDDKTGKLVSGNRNAEKFMVYEWDLARTSGKLTSESAGITRTVCPACGAPVDVNASARCEYCGSIINSESFDWAIYQIKGISQTTRYL